MTRKGKDIEIISVSLPKKTVDEVDAVIAELGYPSRSELVRDAIRALIKSKEELDKLEGQIEGVLTILYDHRASQEVSNIRHDNMHIFRSFMHSDFSNETCRVGDKGCMCCEVLMFSGDADTVREAYYKLRSIKHVVESTLFVA
jgi:metal-responsive CopG/Arc/MetJ family transcriptional regulator